MAITLLWILCVALILAGLAGTVLPEARIDVSGLWGAVEGYAITAPESPRG